MHRRHHNGTTSNILRSSRRPNSSTALLLHQIMQEAALQRMDRIMRTNRRHLVIRAL